MVDVHRVALQLCELDVLFEQLDHVLVKLIQNVDKINDSLSHDGVIALRKAVDLSSYLTHYVDVRNERLVVLQSEVLRLLCQLDDNRKHLICQTLSLRIVIVDGVQLIEHLHDVRNSVLAERLLLVLYVLQQLDALLERRFKIVVLHHQLLEQMLTVNS